MVSLKNLIMSQGCNSDAEVQNNTFSCDNVLQQQISQETHCNPEKARISS